MDPYRLPRHVVPKRYDLRLAPNLQDFTFSGEETVTVEVREPIREIWLNAAELRISRAALSREGEAPLTGNVALDDLSERCRIQFDREVEPGNWALHLVFQGALNDKLRGFYRSRYKDQAGNVHVLAATQFEATDARRAFPCWDEPDFKAVFATTLLIDPALTAVSNTAVLDEELQGDKKVIRFADSIPMSTYLVAFVVGELEATDAAFVGRTPVRVWCVPGKKRLASFALQIATFSLRMFEEYYGVPYPGDKLDLLAIPDFASGAMENLGAITFRETALLVDEQVATHAEMERVADVVAHENAHMWFGDLVTMAWWNGLWLNEAFATFLEMVAVDAWKPEWQRWTTFGVSRAAALMVDGLQSTRPVEYPVAAPRDADAMFDVLTYEKGASVLRMMEQYLGPEVFRAGVRRYLEKHAYANAETGDLWLALGEASRQDIPGVMDGWVFRPGYPVVTAEMEGDQILVLRQRRFTYLPLQDPAAVSSDGQQLWHVPVQVRVTANGKSRVERVLLKEQESRVELPAGYESVFVNEGGHGFYRVRHTPELLDRLLRYGLERVAPIERFNLVNDTWAAVLAGLVPVTEYLDLTARFRGERDKNVWTILLATFHSLNRLIEPADRPDLERLVRDRAIPALTALGEPVTGESELVRQLRGDLVRAVGTLGNESAVQRRAADWYARYLSEPAAVDANIVAAVIPVLAHAGNAERYEGFLQRFRSAKTPQDEQRFLYSLAAFRQPELIGQTLTRCLNGEIRTQDAPYVIRSLLMSVYGRELTWTFFQVNWDRMKKDFPEVGVRRMCEGVIGLVHPRLEQEVRQFFADRNIQLGGKTLAQYLEQLRIAVRLCEREGAALKRYLSQA